MFERNTLRSHENTLRSNAILFRSHAIELRARIFFSPEHRIGSLALATTACKQEVKRSSALIEKNVLFSKKKGYISLYKKSQGLEV